MNSCFDQLGITVLERGWLSSNSTVIVDPHSAWVVDTGYCTHADQTVELVRHTIGHRKLVGILNTHLHSDHCGGNAALAAEHSAASTWIPPGQATAVAEWDAVALTYQPTGQQCPRFSHDQLLKPGEVIRLGVLDWEIHAAPGHDPHAVVLFQRDHGVLISGDALWENGFGVVFPELEGESAFDLVSETLDLIQELQPEIVIPGHGRPFHEIPAALQRARDRLEQFQSSPRKHAEYAGKVLIKFRLLEQQRTRLSELQHWYRTTPYFELVSRHQPGLDLSLPRLLEKLAHSNAARIDGEWVINV